MAILRGFFFQSLFFSGWVLAMRRYRYHAFVVFFVVVFLNIIVLVRCEASNQVCRETGAHERAQFRQALSTETCRLLSPLRPRISTLLASQGAVHCTSRSCSMSTLIMICSAETMQSSRSYTVWVHLKKFEYRRNVFFFLLFHPVI